MNAPANPYFGYPAPCHRGCGRFTNSLVCTPCDQGRERAEELEKRRRAARQPIRLRQVIELTPVRRR